MRSLTRFYLLTVFRKTIEGLKEGVCITEDEPTSFSLTCIQQCSCRSCIRPESSHLAPVHSDNQGGDYTQKVLQGFQLALLDIPSLLLQFLLVHCMKLAIPLQWIFQLSSTGTRHMLLRSLVADSML